MPAHITAKSVISVSCPQKFMRPGDIHRFRSESTVTVDNNTNANFVAGIKIELREKKDIIDSSEYYLEVGASSSKDSSLLLLEKDYQCTVGDKILVIYLTVFDKTNPSDVFHKNWRDCQFLVE